MLAFFVARTGRHRLRFRHSPNRSLPMIEVSRGCDLSVLSGEILHLREVRSRVGGSSVKVLGFLDALDTRTMRGKISLEGESLDINTTLLAGKVLNLGGLYHFIGEIEPSERSGGRVLPATTAERAGRRSISLSCMLGCCSQEERRRCACASRAARRCARAVMYSPNYLVREPHSSLCLLC